MTDSQKISGDSAQGRAVPCRDCKGYGYFGHTNPRFGVECPECHGSGMTAEHSDFEAWPIVCDRCGDPWRIAEVRPDLPCCPVPLCDPCADLHRREVAEEAVDFGRIDAPRDET